MQQPSQVSSSFSSRNLTTDIFKLLASFFVVLIHSEPGITHESIIIRSLGRWAVPFFFMVSGYFYQRSLEKEALAAVKRNFTKILIIIIVANVIYLPVLYSKGGLSVHLSYLLHGYGHLWFLPAMLIGFVVLYLCHIYNIKTSILIALSVLIVTLAILTGTYSFYLKVNPAIFTTKLRPLLAIPFMYFGAYYYKHSLNFIFSPISGIIFLLVGLCMQTCEAYYLLNGGIIQNSQEPEFLIGTTFFAIGTFILSMTPIVKNETLSHWGRDYSLFIYLYHPLFIFLLLKLGYPDKLGHYFYECYPIPIFLITFLTGFFLNKYLPRVFLFLNGSIKESFKR